MTVRAGSRADATDFALPDETVATGNGANTITVVAFGNLPSFGAQVQLTNPHPNAQLRCRVLFAAMMSSSDGTALWVCPAISGSVAISAGAGGGGAAGLGEMLHTTAAAMSAQHGEFSVLLPVSANSAVFTLQAYRAAATGTQKVDYPVLRVVPSGYVWT